jgi:hypothetical protein
VPSGHHPRTASLDEAGRLRTNATSITASPTSSSALLHFIRGAHQLVKHTPRSSLLSFHFLELGLVVWELELS